MPSANKTANYGLNQWQGNEYPKRQDFVDDNAKIDAALAEKIMPLAAATETAVTGTTAQQIASYTPAASVNLQIAVYLRITAKATVTVAVSYADAAGNQTKSIKYSPGGLYFPMDSFVAGSYSLPPLFINAAAGTPVSVKVTADAGGKVYVSAAILGV